MLKNHCTPWRSGTLLRRVVPCLLLGAGLLALGACMRMDVLPKPDGAVVLPLSHPRAVDKLTVPLAKDPTKSYRIGPRDVVHVDVRKDPTLTKDYTVTEEGKILVPNINPVDVSGKTTDEVTQELNTQLAEYIREPDVKVGVQEYRSKVVYVVGQVRNPGPQIMRADMLTLAEAVYSAGLPNTDAAVQRTQVITPDINHPVVRQIDLTKIIYKGIMRENILLKPGDIVYVPAKYSANFSAAIQEFTRPANEYYDLRYKMNLSNQDFGSDNNN